MIKVFGGVAGSFQKFKFWEKRAKGGKGLNLCCSNMVAIGHIQSNRELEMWLFTFSVVRRAVNVEYISFPFSV